jgi:hypothetical protein
MACGLGGKRARRLYRQGDMMGGIPETSDGKARRAARRPAAKPAAGQGAAKVKATIRLSVEADRRLSVHAAMTGQDRSEVVEGLIRDHLRRYVVQDRGGADSNAGDDAAA